MSDYTDVIDVEDRNREVDAAVTTAIQNDAVTKSQSFTRVGLDASGMTDEFDAISSEGLKNTLAKIDDPSARDRVMTSWISFHGKMHDTYSEYERAQVLSGALEQVKSRGATCRSSTMDLVRKKLEARTAAEKANADWTQANGGEVDQTMIRDNVSPDAVMNDVKTQIMELHRKTYDDYRALGMTHDKAYDAATQMAKETFSGLCGDLDAAGYVSDVGYMLGRMMSPDATKTPVMDENGEQKMENGKPVWDEGKITPAGAMWMTVEELGKLKEDNDSAIAKAARDAAAKDKIKQETSLAEVGHTYTKGLMLLTTPDNTYDPDKLNETISTLSALALNSDDPKVIDHANVLTKQLQERANTMVRRQHQWSMVDSKMRTARDFYALIDSLERAGNVSSLVSKVGYDKDGNNVYSNMNLVDIWQRKIAAVKNAMYRHLIPESEGKELLDEYKKNFCKDNWAEAAKFLGQYESEFGGGKLTVDIDASWNAYVALKGDNADSETEATKLGYPNAGLAMQAMFNGEGSWENGVLDNAKYYVYKYVKNGKTLILKGKDVQKLADAVKTFQTRNKNPTPEMVDKMLSGVFDDIMTTNVIWGRDGVEIFMGSYEKMANDYIDRYYKGGTMDVGDVVGTMRMDPRVRAAEDFDNYLLETRGADLYENIKKQ